MNDVKYVDNDVKYVDLERVDPKVLSDILNEERVRKHLVKHELFNAISIKEWIQNKIDIDNVKGCRVRAVLYRSRLAGWCGIQKENNEYEIAIVLGKSYWGIGKQIFRDVLLWTREFDHEYILIHFHHTRPEYKYLKRISSKVFETKMLNDQFTTYQIGLDDALIQKIA